MTLFYARETTLDSTTYVRFTTRATRAYWISKSPNRVAVTDKAGAHYTTIAALIKAGVTWEHIDGVSYARPAVMSPEPPAASSAYDPTRAPGVAWEDVQDDWTPAIKAAHPARGGSPDKYDTCWAIAMQMVGHRHSKGALIELVNWLLVENRRLGGNLGA